MMRHVAGAATGDSEALGHAHFRGSAILLVGRVMALVFTVTTQVVLVRALTTTEFGGFAYAIALAASGAAVLSLGQGKMLSRFTSVYEEDRDYGRMFGAIVLVVGTIAVTSMLGSVAALLFIDDLARFANADSEAIGVLLILLLLAPMDALDQVFISLFATFSNPMSIFFRRYLLAPVLRLSVVLLLLWLEGDATFVAVGYVGAQFVGLVVAGALLVRLLRGRGLMHHIRPRSIKLPVRAVFAFSLPSMATDLLQISMATGSTVILGNVRGLVDVAEYRAVWPAARLNELVYSSFSTLFVPMITRLHARGARPALREAYWRTAVFLAVGSFPVFAMTTVFARETTVTLFGERYAGSAPVLALLAVGYYVNAALGFSTHTLTVHSRLRYLISVSVAAGVLNVVLSFALIPRFGMMGAAGANCSALILQSIANQAGLRRCIGTGFIDRDFVRPYAFVALGACLLLGVRELTSPGIVGASLLVLLVSVALVFLTRRWLKIDETFPRVMTVPLLARLLSSAPRPGQQSASKRKGAARA